MYFAFADELRPGGTTFERALDRLLGGLRRRDLRELDAIPALKRASDGPQTQRNCVADSPSRVTGSGSGDAK